MHSSRLAQLVALQSSLAQFRDGSLRGIALSDNAQAALLHRPHSANPMHKPAPSSYALTRPRLTYKAWHRPSMES